MEINKTQDEIQAELMQIQMREDLLSYCIGVYPKFVVTDFAKACCKEIQDVFDGHNDRLILVGPPRHGKSLVTSELGPSYFLGKYPEKKIIAASHTQDLADAFGAKVRDNMSSPVHEAVMGVAGSLRNKSRAAAGSFKTNMNGEYNTVGVGGTPIGKGADVFIIDDPIRSRADVDKESNREFLKNWYSSAVLSRLEGQGGIILMHQRWHEDDLAGWLIREFPEENWRVVMFPALIETEFDKESDYLNRDYGEPLVPELHSTEKLLRLKGTMQPRDWLAMYQGQPRSSEGDEFSKDSLQVYDIPPENVAHSCNVYIIVDPATTKKKTSDYTVMTVLGTGSDGNFYILDIVRDRMDLRERTENLIYLHRKWRPNSVAYEGYGMSSDVQHIEYEQENQNYRFPIVELKPRVKKEERIRRLVPDMANSRWYAPAKMIKSDMEGNEYDAIEILKEEMTSFPVGKHEDVLDTIASVYDIQYSFPNQGDVTGYRKSGKKISPW